VTGGASGIGLAVAHEALSRGLHVAIGDIQQDAIEPALAELRAAAGGGLAVEGFMCDVTDAAGVDAFAARVHGSAAFGGAPVTVLHCNAGVAVGASTLTSTPADWDFTFNVNVFGVVVSPRRPESRLQRFLSDRLSSMAEHAALVRACDDPARRPRGRRHDRKHRWHHPGPFTRDSTFARDLYGLF
jgi:NAD(P)-dependent dehydrogenase (short-subunit alcohol dehydrogenase family)